MVQNAAPVVNSGGACGFIAYLQALRCLPGMAVLIAYAELMADVVVDVGPSHRCMTIITALERMLRDHCPNTEPVHVKLDYRGDLHSLFIDRGVPSINEFMKLTMDVSHDLIQTMLCMDGCPNEMLRIPKHTLYVADVSETHTLMAYLPRIPLMLEHGLELKSLVLQTDRHFIALAMYGDTIFEYDDAHTVRRYKSWSAVIMDPRFVNHIVTSAWYYHGSGMDAAEHIWNLHLNAKYMH